MTEKLGLTEWRSRASVGDKVIYHTGDLAMDRLGDPVLDGIAVAAMRLSDAGRVALTQRRVSPGVYEYVATAQDPQVEGRL